ncbi:Lcl2 protein [Saccharomycopsis crataegensis]|uniref:Long chronological lifespan protein 2 n=1 Tax=Saccharomycopsis crataegensis TaxID=43959 RepID=A0AAV5QNS2_9ASCO|nr:Lcl2 protein [Saccharomycopsis crataegensis]
MISQVLSQSSLLVLLLLISNVNAFFNFFHQEDQRPAEKPYEEQVLNSDCREYVCPATKQCVKSPIECDCPFPSSQIKCILPGKTNYVCISKPAIVDNDELQKKYDDPHKASKERNKGVRDCGWVIDAWNGDI